MPRIDSITGCPVMTQAEFWQAEAIREGKGRSGSELCEEFWTKAAQAEDEYADRVEAEWKTPQFIMDRLLEDWKARDEEYRAGIECPEIPGDSGLPPVKPVEVVEVLSANYSGGMRGSNGHVEAMIRYDDGIVRRTKWSMSHSHATRMEPEDSEEYVDIFD